MIFPAFVLGQAKLVSLPVEFIELTRVADELSRASGKSYKIDPSLSRETVYLSTKDWSVENVSKRVATAFRAEWQKEGEVFVFRRNSKVFAEMREVENDIIRQRILAQREKEIDPIAQQVIGDSLPYRLELAKERDSLRKRLGENDYPTDRLNELDAITFKLQPEILGVRDCVNQAPQNWWGQSEPSQELHFTNVPHALARRMNAPGTLVDRVVEQSRQDSSFLSKLSDDEQRKLEHYLNVSLRRKPAQGPITLWTTITASSPTKWGISSTSWDNQMLSVGSASATIEISKKSPLPTDKALDSILKNRVDDPKYISQYFGKSVMDRVDFEPAQVLYGPALREIGTVNPELTIIVPDEAVPVTQFSPKKYRQPFKTVQDALEKLSSTLIWEDEKSGVLVGRPELMLRHEMFRSNRRVVRPLVRQLTDRGYITLENAIAFAKTQPMLSVDRYAVSVEDAYESFGFGGATLHSPNQFSTFRFLGELESEQIRTLLTGGTLLGRQLSPTARRILATCLESSSLQLSRTGNGKNASISRILQSVMAFFHGFTDRTVVACSIATEPNLIMRPGRAGSVEVADVNSVAISQLLASEGKVEGHYPKFHTVTFQPISLHHLQLNISDGLASARLQAAYSGIPGEEVKSTSQLPAEYRDALAFRLHAIRNNTTRIGKPPPL